MDLIETNDGPRHPWEKSRAAFFTGVLERALGGRGAFDVLDCGAGDAFFSATMSRSVAPRSVTCWDASYDDATVARLGELYGRAGTAFSFTRTMPDRRFDLVLMLDVIEHVEDDAGFVSEIVETCLAPESGLALVSVPAWQRLFSQHDELLLHHRRYSPAQCDRVLRAAGLELVERGGLFHSLVAPRLASVALESARSLVGRTSPLAASAASSWGAGRLVTSVVDAALRADNAVSRAAARARLNVPGLSYWALARRRR